MSKIFEFDARKGSYIDPISGDAGTNTNGEFKKLNKGLAWQGNGNNSNINYGDNAANNLAEDDFAVEIYYKNDDKLINSQLQYIIIQGDSSNGFRLFINDVGSGLLRIGYGDGSLQYTDITSTNICDNKFHHLILNFDRDGNLDSYVDNVLDDQSDISGKSGSFSNSTDFLIGNTANSSAGFIGLVRIHDGLLSTIERNELYQEFLRSNPTISPKDRFKYPKPTDLSRYQIDKVEQTYTSDFSSGTDTWRINTDDEVASLINDSGDIILTVSESGTNTARPLLFPKNFTATANLPVKIEIDYTVESGTPDLYGYNIGNGVVQTNKMFSGSGTYTIEGTYNILDEEFYLYWDGRNEFSIRIHEVRAFSKSGLVAAYNFIPSNGTLVDISGNGNNGVINGAVATNNGMYFDESNESKVTIPKVTLSKNNATMAFCGTLYDLGGKTAYFGGGAGTAFNTVFISTGTFYLESEENAEFWTSIGFNNYSGKQVCIVITADNGTTRTYINGELVETTNSIIGNFDLETIGSDLGNYGRCHFKEVQVSNRPWSEQEAIDFHNKYARRVVLLEDFSDYAVGDVL